MWNIASNNTEWSKSHQTYENLAFKSLNRSKYSINLLTTVRLQMFEFVTVIINTVLDLLLTQSFQVLQHYYCIWMSRSWSIKNSANTLKFIFQIVNGLICHWLRSLYTLCMSDFLVVMACGMLLGLQLGVLGRDTIHNFFGVPRHEATQGCSNYVSWSVELSSIYFYSFLFTLLPVSLHLFIFRQIECPMLVQKVWWLLDHPVYDITS